MNNALMTFTLPQLVFIVGVLVFIVGVLGSIVWWGITRLIATVDKRIESLGESIDAIRENHPTRNEVDRQISGVHRRIDDLRDLPRRRHDDDTGQFRIPAGGL